MMASHFFRKNCGLRLVRPKRLLRGFRKILQTGIGASALDLGAVTIGMMMNNQIMKYGGTTELAIFGVISTLMALFQALFAGVGQAAQPIVSTNYGAGRTARVKATWKLSFATVIVLGILFTAIGELFPVPVTAFFIKAAPAVLKAAPRIFRLFFPMFLFLGITVLADYYLQSIMEVNRSMVIGLAHSVLVSGAALFGLPLLLGMNGVWLAMPVAEWITGLIGASYIIGRANRALSEINS
ncbi:MAG: MATE family efflux transporter [Eubacteriales bacterium]|nr:MATE family efflux transporter [Eubacteriales bacterium]